jgi:hypothetical protein
MNGKPEDGKLLTYSFSVNTHSYISCGRPSRCRKLSKPQTLFLGFLHNNMRTLFGQNLQASVVRYFSVCCKQRASLFVSFLK